MTKYTCERCLKEFSQKSHYDKHQNKKKPCQDNKGKIEEVVENFINKKFTTKLKTKNTDVKKQLIINDDCIKQMKEMKADSVDIIICDPPYNIGKDFGNNSFVDYYGLTPQDERQQNIKRFQEDDACRFFIGTPQTGGYGITLTAASNMIYYSNGYDLEKRQQSEARIDRIGQEKPMTYIDIICEDTVDERIVKALRKKVNIASQVMGEELKAWI